MVLLLHTLCGSDVLLHMMQPRSLLSRSQNRCDLHSADPLMQVYNKTGAQSATTSTTNSELDALLAVFTPLEVSELLVACADLGVQQELMDQLQRLLQVGFE